MNIKTFAATVCLAFISTAAVADHCDDKKQLETLALNIYHEARGEPIDGMRMVGEVTLNRVASRHYPNNVCDVVYQKSQFSWVTEKKGKKPRERDVWILSLEIAEELLEDNNTSYDHMATHFLNPSAVKRMPKWTKKFTKVERVGNHVFYRM
jgi:N-acetylmuramoyl-L-alanine amidase